MYLLVALTAPAVAVPPSGTPTADVLAHRIVVQLTEGEAVDAGLATDRTLKDLAATRSATWSPLHGSADHADAWLFNSLGLDRQFTVTVPQGLGAAEMADWARPRENTALGLGLAGYSSTFAAGIAEVIKYGLLGDREFHDWLEENMDKLLERDQSALAYAIERSCRDKQHFFGVDRTISCLHVRTLDDG